MNIDRGRLHFIASIDNSKLRDDAVESRNILRGIGDAAKREGENIEAQFGKIGKLIAGAFAVGQLTNFAREVINVRSEVQSLEVSFETLLGNKEKAAAMFGALREYAVKTPMMLKDLAAGAQTMLAFNIEAEKVMPILKAIGDISMGDAQKFNSLTLAFSQMSASGKLMGQDLLQMINAGFNPLSVISERTGKSIGDLKKEMEEGKISADMITNAFIEATSVGGKFYGMLESQSQTLQGAISNLQGAWEDMLNEIGENSEGVFATAIDAATQCIQHYDAFVKVLLSVVAAYGAYKAVLIATYAIEKTKLATTMIQEWYAMGKALGFATANQMMFNSAAKANPYIMLASAITGVITSLILFCDTETEAEKRIDKANAALEEQERQMEKLKEQTDVVAETEKIAAESISEEINKIEILNSTIHDNTASIFSRQRAIESLRSIIPDYYAEIDAEGRLHQETTDSINNHIASLNRLAMAEALQTKRKELYSQLMNAEIDRSSAVRDKDVAEKTLKKAVSELEAARQRTNATIEAGGSADFIGGSSSKAYQAGASHYAKSYMRVAAEEKKAAEKELAAVNGRINLADQSYENAKNKIAILDEMLKEYQDVVVNQNTANGTIENPTSTGEDFAKKALERIKAIRDYEASVKSEVERAELEIAQADVDAKEDGYEKSLAQINLNYKRLSQEQKKRESEMLDALAGKKLVEWINENPNSTEQEQDAFFKKTREKLKRTDLNKEQVHVLTEYDRIINDYVNRETNRALNEILKDVKTYEEQRLEITQKYADKRNALYDIKRDKNGNGVSRSLKPGVTQGNINELNRQEGEALASIDKQFASREASFQAWCEWIANLSLDELKKALNEAEKALEEAEKRGGADLAEKRAKFASVKETVEKKSAGTNMSTDKRSLKEWQDLYRTLNDCAKAFKEIGEAVGGTVGEIISAAGEIATSTTSMINGIVQLTQAASTAVEATSVTASKAIQALEKASVILSIISAAFQIATAIANLFNDDDKKQEEIEHLQKRIDQLEWELDNQNIGKMQSQHGTALALLNSKLRETRKELAEGQTHWQQWLLMMSRASYNQDLMQKTAEKLVHAYGTMEYTTDKIFGADRYERANELLENIAQRQILVQEQINEEASKKDSDDGKIQEWRQKIEELGHQAVEIINNMVEDIIGDTSTGIAEQLADAFVSAFKSGEDAAEAWRDKVNDIVADILKRMMVQKFLEEPLGQIFNEYKAKWFPNGKFAENGLDVIINSMTEFANDLNGTLSNFQEAMEYLPDDLKEYFIGDEASREAYSKGIATASQESVDELNGRATAIQSHTYSICENTKMLLSTTQSILQSVMNIEGETNGFGARVERMESHMKDIRNSLDDITTKGIDLKR